jgi:hypothetical protein
VYQTQQFSNVHFGRRHDLNNADGVRQAILELDSVRRTLQTRAKTLERGDTVVSVGVEPDSSDGEDEDGDDEDEGDEFEDHPMADPFDDDGEDSCVEGSSEETDTPQVRTSCPWADASGFTLGYWSSPDPDERDENEDVPMDSVIGEEPSIAESSPETDWEGFSDSVSA